MTDTDRADRLANPWTSDVERLCEEMCLMDLPEPPCPAPETPKERGAWLLQNEGLTLYGELLVTELVYMAQEGTDE